MKSTRASAWIAPLLALLAISVVSTACGGSEPADPLDLVPAQANLLGFVDLAQVAADADVIAGYGLIAAGDETAPATLDELLASTSEDIGLDLSGFGQLILFGDLDLEDAGLGAEASESDASETPDFFGILASTDLDRDELFDAVRAGENVEAVEGEHEGVKLLVLAESGGDSDGDGAVALVDGVVAFGSFEAVRAVIDVAKADAPAVGGALLGFYNELGDVWSKVVLTVPDGLADDLGDPSELGLPFDVSTALEVSAVGVVATKETTDAIVKIVLRYPTAEPATETAQALNDLIELLIGFVGDEISDLTDGLNVGSVGNDVTIEFRQGVQETLDLLQDSLSGDGGLGSIGL
jgi:hypothetical protein